MTYVLHRLPILERLNKTCLYFVLILTAVEQSNLLMRKTFNLRKIDYLQKNSNPTELHYEKQITTHTDHFQKVLL